MRTPEQTKATKRRFIEALKKTLGIVTTAAEKCKVSRETIYKWKREDPDFKAEMDLVNEIVLDFAESSLHKQINAGNPTSTIFFLKTRGRSRGYIEKQEIESKVEMTGNPVIQFGNTRKKE